MLSKTKYQRRAGKFTTTAEFAMRAINEDELIKYFTHLRGGVALGNLQVSVKKFNCFK